MLCFLDGELTDTMQTSAALGHQAPPHVPQVFDIEDVEDLCLDFTIKEDAFGVTTTKGAPPLVSSTSPHLT